MVAIPSVWLVYPWFGGGTNSIVGGTIGLVGVLSVWSMHLWFGEGNLTLVGVPLVWWVYLWFGGVPLDTFSLVGVKEGAGSKTLGGPSVAMMTS